MKRSELIFNIVSIPVDIISLCAAGLVSFYFRLRVSSYVPILFQLNLSAFTRIMAVAISVLLLIFALWGLYNLRGTRKFSSEFRKIFSAISVALLLVIVLFFFDKAVFPSRLIVLVSWAASIFFVVLGRFLLKQVQAYYLARGFGLHRLVIIDGPGSESSLIEAIQNDKELGYRVVAVLSNEATLQQDLERLYLTENIEEIMQANPSMRTEVNQQLVAFARSRGLAFNFVPNLYEVQRNVVDTETIKGIPIIVLKNTPLEGWGKVVKRIFDIVASLVCIIITLPFFVVIAILVKLDSPGKVLYAAPRGGQDKDFTFYKFRTMFSHLSVGEGYGGEQADKVRKELWKVNARGGENGPFLKIKDDPRVTRIGRFLRKTKLDEIPQFYNVLRGDMSMVGPRAHVIDEVERYRDQHRRFFTVKPGIFGLSQIAQIAWPDLPFEEEVRLNTYYIENWSVWLDVTILAKSAWALVTAAKTKEIY